MNTSPPAVTIGPPRFGSPVGGEGICLIRESKLPGSPSGDSHFFFPVFRSIATTVPHGGGEQGTPLSARMIFRRITYGVPCILVYSSPSRDAFCRAWAVSC